MLSRKTLSVLVLLALVAIVASFSSSWADADRGVAREPVAAGSAPEAASPSAMVPSSGAPSVPAGHGKPAASPLRVAGGSKARDAKEDLQEIMYAVGNVSVQTAMKILKIAAPDAQFIADPGNASVGVTATPADHERIRALMMELRGSLTYSDPLPAKTPMDSDPFAAAPAVSSTLSLPKDAKNVTRTAVLDTGSLSAKTLMRILEAAAPEAGFTVDQDDDKSLTVSAPSDEFKKIEDALGNLPKGMSDLRVIAIMSMAASDAALRSARLRGQAKVPSGYSPPLRSYQSPPSTRYVPSTSHLQSYKSTAYAPSAARRHEPADPEMAQMEQSDAIAGKKVAEIVKECKTATGEEQQAEVRWKLKQAVLEHFAARQAKRELEVARLEARLEKVRQSITKRSELQDQIVDRHISELLGEADDLAF